MLTAVIWPKSKPEVEFRYGGRFGEFNFNGMSFQSHVSRCKIGLLPLGEFTVLRATRHIVRCSHLAKSMSWSCHIAGVRIPSAILKLVFRHILFIFVFLMQFGLTCLGGAVGSVAVRAAWLRWSASLGSRPRLARSLLGFSGVCFEIKFSGRHRGVDGVLLNLWPLANTE